MNFQEAEKTYKELAAQHSSGKLNDAAFEAEVGKLRMQDDQGRWWQIGVQTGEWYMHDGQKWNKAKPPTPAPAPTVAPVAPAPQPSVPATKTPTGVVSPAPQPAKDDKKADAASKGKEDGKQSRASAMPRLFSAKPAGREGGLSRRMLIGIIAAAAIVFLLLVIGGYFVVNNVLGTASKPAATSTRAIAALPSPALPSVVPTQVPTNTPLAPPTPIVTATTSLTSTTSLTPTATFKTPVAPKATATKKPAGTPAPSATATPNVPPGVYAISIETVPPKASIGSTIGFKVTFLNTTGSTQTYKVIVKVYKCPEQCQDFKNSYGETLRADGNLAVGTSQFTTSQNINLGVGLNCDLVAMPYYIDPTSQQVVPFSSLKGNPLYQPFKICQ